MSAADSKLQRLEPSRRNPPHGEQQHENKHNHSEVIIVASRARRRFISARVRSTVVPPTKTGLSQKLKEGGEEEEFDGKRWV